MATFRDPRPYQIGVLASLVGYGVVWLDFAGGLPRVTLLVATCLATQWVCARVWRLPRLDPRSALISGLSLSLLLRTGSPLLAVTAAVVTIGSKFLVRVDGRHVFNPTNFGLVAMMLVTDRVWVSPGQWGSVAIFGALLGCAGILVVHRAARADVTWAFLGAYTALVVGRALWLGDPIAIAFHTLQSGGLVLFTFFMISDPKTTPDSRAGRVVFALLVALGAAYAQFVLYEPSGPLWSLAACATGVPLLNRLFPGRRYVWQRCPSPALQPGRAMAATEDPDRNRFAPVAADASRRAALLVAYIRPVCALLAPGRAGASTPTAANLFRSGS